MFVRIGSPLVFHIDITDQSSIPSQTIMDNKRFSFFLDFICVCVFVSDEDVKIDWVLCMLWRNSVGRWENIIGKISLEIVLRSRLGC
jgi:hypothetical protein